MGYHLLVPSIGNEWMLWINKLTKIDVDYELMDSWMKEWMDGLSEEHEPMLYASERANSF